MPGTRAKRDGLVPPTPTADGKAVLVGLRSPSSGSSPSVAGVAALSADKGEKVWAFEPPADTVISSAHPGPAYTVLALTGTGPSVVVLDNRDGREAWRADGLALRAATESIVIAGDSTLAGYDITGGAKLWQHPASALVVWADAKVVAVSSAEGREPVTDLLDARTGGLLKRLDASANPGTCASGATGLACDVEDASGAHRLLTMTYPEGVVGVSGTALSGRVVALSTWRGRIAVGESTLDAAGNPVTPPLPGQVLATGGSFAAFGPPVGLMGVPVAVYAVAS